MGHDFWTETWLLSFPNVFFFLLSSLTTTSRVPSIFTILERRQTSLQPTSPTSDISNSHKTIQTDNQHYGSEEEYVFLIWGVNCLKETVIQMLKIWLCFLAESQMRRLIPLSYQRVVSSNFYLTRKKNISQTVRMSCCILWLHFSLICWGVSGENGQQCWSVFVWIHPFTFNKVMLVGMWLDK